MVKSLAACWVDRLHQELKGRLTARPTGALSKSLEVLGLGESYLRKARFDGKIDLQYFLSIMILNEIEPVEFFSTVFERTHDHPFDIERIEDPDLVFLAEAERRFEDLGR